MPATVFYTRIPATGGGGLITRQSIQSYDARERLKISTCGKNAWCGIYFSMKCIFRVVHVTPLEFKMAANMAEV